MKRWAHVEFLFCLLLALFLFRVEDIPGLSFLSLNTDTATNPNQSATENKQQYQHQGGGAHASNPFPCPTQPLGFGKTACARDGLGDSWGGGVGAGWGAGLGLWGGLRGSLEGAREFLGHLKAYLGFYYREEAAMFAPLVEARRKSILLGIALNLLAVLSS